MSNISKIKTHYIITVLWALYILYNVLYEFILPFPYYRFELIIPPVMQIIIVVTFIKLFNEKYLNTIKLTSLSCCVLIILWHFNMRHHIPIKSVVLLFLFLPIISGAVLYIIGKIKKVVALPVWKNFGISLLLTFANFLVAVFTFYIFFFWML